MVDGKSVVTQTHEIQCMVKKLRLLKIAVPNEFVAGGHYCQIASFMEGFHNYSQTQEGAHVYFGLDRLS
jgi:hypothetical protein